MHYPPTAQRNEHLAGWHDEPAAGCPLCLADLKAAKSSEPEDFEEPDWHGGYTDADLDVLADEAADRHYDRD